MRQRKSLGGTADRRPRASRISAGLCESCAHLRLVSSPRSVFVRCGRADEDPRFPRYPALPVVSCEGYRHALGALPEGGDSG